MDKKPHEKTRSGFGGKQIASLLAAWLIPALAAGAQTGPGAARPYPSIAIVEYVGECLAKNGGAYVYLHKCSCAIDRIAEQLPYDEYVESSTFAKYATLSGERSGIFRDPEHARSAAKRYRGVQNDALRACGVDPATPPAR